MALAPARIHCHGPRCPCEFCAWRNRRQATAAYWLARGMRALAGIEPIRTERRN